MKRLVSLWWGTLIVFVALLCIGQFRSDDLWPFAIALLIFALIWRFRPSLRATAGILLGAGVVTFIADSAFFRHRIGLELRTWSPVWDCEEIVGIVPSPLGQSTAYIVGGGFVDSSYWAYISDGGIFPKHSYIETGATDVSYPKDMVGTWNGSVFSIGNVRYDEKRRRLYSL